LDIRKESRRRSKQLASRLRSYSDNRVKSARALLYNETRVQISGHGKGDRRVLWVTGFRLATSSDPPKSVLTARLDVTLTDTAASLVCVARR
jgi:hypothetical protein